MAGERGAERWERERKSATWEGRREGRRGWERMEETKKIK